MKIKLIAVAALAAGALTVSAGASSAEPANPTAATATTGVNYHATNTGAAAVITIDAGSMVVEDNTFKIKADDGTVLAGVPLSVRIDDIDYPVEANIAGGTATLTPVALPYQDEAPWRTRYEREQAAFSRAALQITSAAAAGAALGTAIGGAAGCIAGAFAGAVVTGILATLFGAGPLAGCLAGIPIGVGVGAFGGAILLTAPVAIASVIQYFTTINEPFTPNVSGK
ncbi:hypothetical protein [Nocardia sp. NPDC046763]|uniref:hypothetical protein n=1 Tax=Nocardia sp. NPDC046763 TaxID=3155256 RepID=UPI0033DD681E